MARKSRIRHAGHRFFFGCEGESEHGFVAWLRDLAAGQTPDDRLPPAFSAVPLARGAGEPLLMLRRAIEQRDRRARQTVPYRHSILLIDGDRLEGTERSLRAEALRHRFTLIIQRPNHEAWLLRLHDGLEQRQSWPRGTMTELRKLWLGYEKGASSQKLGARFSLDQLRRAARHDDELAQLLRLIGLL